ncbi:hypothetical protein SESBI_10793 [Sesbania bispinosa]|nr:hypothetical protein SESBI_10793 [Sesbania bispinosa]
MVHSRLSQIGSTLCSSPHMATTDSTIEFIPRSISLAILPRPPLPRAAPASTKSRKWIYCIPLTKRPFDIFMVSSGDTLFSSSVISSSIKWDRALLHFYCFEAPSLELGPSLLFSQLLKEEFPWSSSFFVSKLTPSNGWAEWVDHVFSIDKPFVVILLQAGIIDLIKLSPFP